MATSLQDMSKEEGSNEDHNHTLSCSAKEFTLESDPYLKSLVQNLLQHKKVTNVGSDGRIVDKIYSNGCYDLFHQGHRNLLQRMKALGGQVIIGVHDDRSVTEMKNRIPIDSTEKRMKNVKQYADVVYCITSVDATSFLRCIINLNENCSRLFVRGNDSEEFSGREFIGTIMPIAYLPYTVGISTTLLREKLQLSSCDKGDKKTKDGQDDK